MDLKFNRVKKKPKALIFFQYLPPWRIDVFNEMSSYYDLTIVFTDSEREGFKYNREELLALLKPDITTFFLSNGFKIGNRPIRFGILSFIREIKPNVIFSHEYAPVSIVVAFYKLFFSYKYVITTSDNIKMVQSVMFLKASARKYVLNNADGLVVYSKRVMNCYKKVFPKLRVEICPNIQNPESLLRYSNLFPGILNNYKKKFLLEEKKVVLFSGRLEHVKGLDLLISAFAESNNKDWVLVLVGEGSKKVELFELAKTLGVGDKIVFPGFYSGIDLYAWYGLADLFVLPSRFEPFGAVVNEALILGCPVIASKYIGAVDFINDENGEIFDPMNEREFVETLNKFYVISNSGLYSKKENLMKVSFKKYVSAFYKVLNY